MTSTVEQGNKDSCRKFWKVTFGSKACFQVANES